jgi:hypothetical protein
MKNRPRRKAIECNLIEASKTSPGYFKYKVTIEEEDGSTNVVPAYGKDMQDAISRLVWSERYENVTSSKATAPIMVSLLLVVVSLAGVLAVEHNNPVWILGAIGTTMLGALLISSINRYLKK